ncbi:LOW QUALITY PROTEIN: hypothetical protein PHMEG_00037756 [Phytophthora megakarya]|uniref:Uncharacterized protein n=1 Tax=Phytophthora megakarya TaxID=4795 RepID=A0A225UJ89_9STRA|nr:LOW QUALITY PROTEIN: hypothetical protein PHMEG_00037756 [Phytophthora megakarya]
MGETEETAAVLKEVYPGIPEIGILGTLHGRPAADSGYGTMYKRLWRYAFAVDDLMSISHYICICSQNSSIFCGFSYFYVVLVLPSW